MRRRRILAALMAAALPALAGGAAIPVRPARVMSMNSCTDQLVLMLLPLERIASVTWLSRDSDLSLMARVAMRVPVNHGQAEEVVRQHPDLIVTGTLANPVTAGLLRRIGYPILVVDDVQDFDGIRRITRQVAQAVGEEARGEMLLARMDRDLADLARHPGPAIRVAAWDGAGFSASKGSLYDMVLRTAGAVNIANEPPASGYGAPDMEVLLAAAPALLIQGAPALHRPDMHDDVARHPLVRRFWKGRKLVIRQASYICGTPYAAEAALALREQLRAAAAHIRAPLPFATRAGR